MTSILRIRLRAVLLALFVLSLSLPTARLSGQDWNVAFDGGLVALDELRYAEADSLLEESLKLLRAHEASGDSQTALGAPIDSLEVLDAGVARLIRGRILGYLVETRVQGGSIDLPSALWRYLDAGYPGETLETTLDALEDAARFGEIDRELLVLVAASLSRRFYDPGEFAGSGPGRRLQGLLSRPRIASGIEELISWHEVGILTDVQTDSLQGCSQERLEAQIPRIGAWSWWGNETVDMADAIDATDLAEPSDAADATVHMSAPDAGRALLGTLGTWYMQEEDLARAESYLCVAAVLESDGIMSAPFRELFWTYIDDENFELIQELDLEYDDQFHGADGQYLEPLIDALQVHHWYSPRRIRHNLTLTAIAVGIVLCVVKVCRGGDATGQVVVVVP